MNSLKTILGLVAAIIVTAGMVVTVFSMAASQAQAGGPPCLGQEKDTRSCPNIKICTIRNEEGKKVTECRERSR